MSGEFVARKRADGETQSLYEHSMNVAEIVTSISHYPHISKLFAYLHDLGKLSEAFREYIESGGNRGSVIHAWQGAFLANELFPNNLSVEGLLKEIIGFCITGHHNYLDDGVSPDGTTNHFDKFSHTADSKYFFEEIKGKITKEEKEKLQILFENAKAEMSGLLAQIKASYREKNSANFALGLFVKYLFSCLVDADRLDAYLFETGESYARKAVNWEPLADIFEHNIAKLPNIPNTPNTIKMNRIRKSISEKCKSAAERGTGIYQLSVPTGGGKTLSSLRFALHHCKKYKKNRIIYVIPYLSIIEQTAKNLRDVLNLPDDNEIILEHHSNVIEPEDERSSEMRKLSSERWNEPIILTTMVQFLESVMSSRSGKLRKFAAMADSVIIFDEIQSVPIKAIHCFNEVATFLSKILNATIILCSATQPTLEHTQRKNLLLQKDAQLIDCTEEFKGIKRVAVLVEPAMDYEAASDFVLKKANENGDCLFIVNTKASARKIYSLLKEKAGDWKVLHLTTSMCPSHRMEIINDIRDGLNRKERIICVATQLIEAGVDVSFSCVARAMAGLDSIAQAAGRCNRNGESAVPKTVYTFPLKEENLDKLSDIKSGKEITEQIVRSKAANSDLLDERIMKEFYHRYFAGKDIRMDYPAKFDKTVYVYAMLSENYPGKRNYTNRTGKPFPHFISHAFHSADRSFSVIDQNTKSVVVMFGNAAQLVETYRKQPPEIMTKEKAKILRMLQSYSVSLYEWEVKMLAEQNALYPLDGETGVMILGANYYAQDRGVVLEAVQDDFII